MRILYEYGEIFATFTKRLLALSDSQTPDSENGLDTRCRGHRRERASPVIIFLLESCTFEVWDNCVEYE